MYKRIINFIFIIFIGCTPAFVPVNTVNTQFRSISSDIDGYDVLGLAKYCDTYLSAPKLPGVSTLLNTFGDPMPCIEKRILKGGLTLVQIDLIDATCWRNNKCPLGAARPTDLKEIERRAAYVYKYAKKYPQIEWQISPALEHDVKETLLVKKMLEAAVKGCPSCKAINSPYSGAKPKGYPLELHGTKVSAYSVSGDGASSYDGDNINSDGNGFNHSDSGKYSSYIWWNELNLRCTGEETFTPPLKRTEKPTLWQFRQAYQITLPEEAKPTSVPKQCITVKNILSPEIYKPNAESYCNGDPRSQDTRNNRPLLILKKSGKPGEIMDVYNKQGAKIGCFAYYAPFSTPGLYRWYMGNCSGQNAYQLYKAFEGEWGYVYAGKGECYLINSVRRLGVYR